MPILFYGREDFSDFQVRAAERNPIFRCPPLRCPPLWPPELKGSFDKRACTDLPVP